MEEDEKTEENNSEKGFQGYQDEGPEEEFKETEIENKIKIPDFKSNSSSKKDISTELSKQEEEPKEKIEEKKEK